MAEHTYEELKKKTVVELRAIAGGLGDEAVKGHSQMNKEHLLVALCQALKIDLRGHRHVVGLDKVPVKAAIREMKKKREEAITAHDREALKRVRRNLHRLNRKVKKAMV